MKHNYLLGDTLYESSRHLKACKEAEVTQNTKQVLHKMYF